MNQNILKELLSYDPDTGVVKWNKRDRSWFTEDRAHKIWNTRYANKTAGTIGNFNGKAYKVIRIFGVSYLMHRVIWMYMKGDFPLSGVDHHDGNGLNNIWSNLSEADCTINNKNLKLFITNTSGVSGVHWCNRDKRWISRINDKVRHLCLGYFKDKFEAICARKSAEVRLGYHINHGTVRAR